MPQSKQPKVYGIATDTIRKGDEIILVDGKRVYGAVGWYRIVNPMKHLGYEYTVGKEIRSTAEDALKLKKKGSIWFMKMADNEGMDILYGAHRDFAGAKIILDLDDDPINTNYDHPDFKALEDRKDMRIRMIKIADHITVSTPKIKEIVSQYNPNITVIPNAIDPEIWKVKRKKKDDKIRIVWISSGSHFADLPILKTVMEDILDSYKNVEFHFAGMVWGDANNDRFFHHNGTLGYKDFPQFFADLNPDICIAPLKDNQFNNCKSNIKWMEAAMLGVPTVASDVLPYRDIKHGKTGYLATSPKQFTKYLKWLIEDKDLREKIGKAAKQDVLDNWTIDKFLPQYQKLFKKMSEKKDITVMTAITGGKDELLTQPEYDRVEYVAFTEQKNESWITKKPCDKFINPVMNAKIHKVLGHKYCDTPYIVWMDGNMTLKQDPHELVKLMGKNDFAFFKHPGRNCLYEEADFCVQLGKGNRFEIATQVKEYAKANFPAKAGMCEMTCFVRKNTPEANDLMEKWWAEICRHSERDQISFPVVFQGQKWATIPGKVADMQNGKLIKSNEFFKYKFHKK
jgi:glycosyltransferase involved in cell wall biosynthesis